MMILVSKPSLPPLEKYLRLLEDIWGTHWISNFSKYSQELEKKISKYLGANNVRLTSSGDTGLIIAIASLNFEKGSEVIVPSFTFNSTVNSVVWNGLVPVFADINPKTLALDPREVAKKINKKTKAILATNVFGNPCDYEALGTAAKKNKLKLIIDSAAAYGSFYKGQKVGAIADVEVFSLSGTKITTSAEGGFIVTKHKYLLKMIDSIRNYGITRNYNSAYLGLNGKISEFNAALGCLTITNITQNIKKRQRLVKKYKELLTVVKEIEFQQVEKGNMTNNTNFCILVSKRDLLVNHLTKRGIQTKIYYRPVHLMSYYKKSFIKLPKTEEVYKKIICLPIFNDMKGEEVEFICKEIKKFYNYD